MAITKFPNGISSMGMPVVGGAYTTTGTIYFVDSSTGSNGNSGLDKDHPFADIDYAIGQCTASKGDIIFVMPGHTETAATQITCDVAGVSIIGMGRGRNCPAITANATTADCFNVSAANVYLENLRIVGAASKCTALINVSGADFTCANCTLEPAAAPLIGITLASGAARATFRDMIYRPSEANADVAIDIEATDVNDLTIQNCDFLFGHSAGCDLGVIRSDGSAVDNVLISNCRIMGYDTVWIDFDSSCKGIVEFCRVYSSSNTTVAEGVDLGALTPIENYVGAYNLAKSGARVPATTATP